MKYKTEYYESKRAKDGYFHFLYKITNKVNGKFYIGVHNTKDLGDGYKGSGQIIKDAFNKYGKKNFEREIISFHNTAEEAYAEEARIVNINLVENKQCYNVALGGKGNQIGMIPVRDVTTGKCKMISMNDPLYNVKYVSVNKGYMPVFNKLTGSHERILTQLFNPDIHTPMHKGKIVLYNTQTGKFEQVDKNDDRRKTGVLVSPSKNKITVIDKDGKTYQVDRTHPDYLNGNLTHLMKNKWTLRNKLTNKCISVPKDSIVDWDIYEYVTCRPKKIDNPDIKKGRLIGEKKYKWYDADDPRFETLDLLVPKPKNARTIYVTNAERTIDIALAEDEIEKFLTHHNGWVFGHKLYKTKSCGLKGKIWVNNGITNKVISKEEADTFLQSNKGWVKGCLINNQADK